MSSPTEATLENLVEVNLPVNQIEADEDNIREVLTGQPIDELAASIEQLGQLQPITVYEIGPDRYRVWMGHRRHAALQRLQERGTGAWVYARVQIVDPPLDNLNRLDKMTAENLQRQQLNPIEEARLYQRYIAEGLTQTQICDRLSVGKSRVSSYLTLLDLSFSMQRAVAAGQTTVSSAIAQVKHYKTNAGQAHGNAGIRRMNASTPHFNPHHPLHDTAMMLCRSKEGHEYHVKLGGACGRCWEYVIHADGKVDQPVDVRYNDPDAPVEEARPTAGGTETFADPRVMMRRVLCVRCSTPAAEYQNRQCSGIRTGPDGVKRRSLFEHHEFKMAVTPKKED